MTERQIGRDERPEAYLSKFLTRCVKDSYRDSQPVQIPLHVGVAKGSKAHRKVAKDVRKGDKMGR